MLKVEKTQKVLRPSAARLIESLRDTGYTFESAVADIIDNSVSANTNEVRIRIGLGSDRYPYLMIADNGDGMDEDEIENAMTYGSPERANPKSLGKFGMGLKTASTSMARKLTLISSKEGDLNIRQWDLDTIKNSNEWYLLEPDIEDYEEHISFLQELTHGGNGTLVVWEKVDRLLRTNEKKPQVILENIIDKLSEHLSGVFYNFLERDNSYPDITISINGKQISPWDPFCRWLNDDGRTRLEVHKNKPFQYEDEETGQDIGEFRVNVYLLPHKSDLTNEEQRRARYGLENQGFHVFREGRMIYSGGWPHRIFVKEPHLNLMRVELLFEHTLDEYFQIDIKKSRIDLPNDLREKLKKVLTPARNEANRKYRLGSTKKSTAGITNQHKKSSDILDKHLEDNTAGSQVGSFDKTSGEAQVRNKYGVTSIKLKFDDSQEYLVQTEESLQDGVLWEPGLVEGNRHAVFLNESHEFYKRFYGAIKDNSNLCLAMDALLWSLAEAELSVLSNTVKSNLEDLRINVSRSLRRLAMELPDVELSENEETEE